MAPDVNTLLSGRESTFKQDDDLIPLCHIVTPIGMLGYGFDEELNDAELARLAAGSVPTAIILDSGSTDSGPAKLALGSMTCPVSSYERDLKKLMALSTKYDVPLIFSSAGGDGTAKHVDELVTVVEDIVSSAFQGGTHTKIVAIYSDVDKTTVSSALRTNRIQGCGPAVPPMTENDIDTASVIVAQMGYEPILDAMSSNPSFNVLVAGRAYDPAPYVAYAAFCNELRNPGTKLSASVLGGFHHMGKIMECGGLCAKPKSKSARATIFTNGMFDITPLDRGSICTPMSVAAHTLYEKTRPDLLAGPGGVLDLTQARYVSLSDKKSIRVSGSAFKSSRDVGQSYTIKVEAARIRGYSSVFMGRMADPILISQLDEFTARVKEYVATQHKGIDQWWQLGLHKSGTDEIFVVGEALAETQELATSLVSCARIACVHGPYSGQKATSGSLAFGIGGRLEVELGPRAEFCMYHLMDVDPGQERSDAELSSGRLFTWWTLVVGEEPRQGRELSRTSSGYHIPAEIESTESSTNRVREAGVLEREERMETLGDLASVLRSKNAGPYEITIDVMFDKPEIYRLVKESGILSSDVVASLYGLSTKDVIYSGFFDQASAWKATIPRIVQGRPAASGSFFDDDVHGSQQYLPVMALKVPKSLQSQLIALSGVGS